LQNIRRLKYNKNRNKNSFESKDAFEAKKNSEYLRSEAAFIFHGQQAFFVRWLKDFRC
jgi:hypothetical protein